MPFRDPILGGSVLLRPAIQSPNYVNGSTGWRVRADGSAELNNVTVRGTLAVGTTIGPGVALPGSQVTGTVPTATNAGSAGTVPATGVTVTGGKLTAAQIDATNLNVAAANVTGQLTAAQIAATAVDGKTITGALVRSAATGNRVEISSVTRGTQTVGEARFYTEVATDTNGGITAFGPADGTLRSLNGTAPAASGIVAPFWKLGYEDVSGSRFDVSADTTYVSKFRALGFASFAGNVDVTGTLTAGNLQKGTATVTSSAGVWVNQAVTFPLPFTAVPVVTLTLQSQPPTSATTVMVTASAVNTTGFTLNYFRSTGPLASLIGWIALA